MGIFTTIMVLLCATMPVGASTVQAVQPIIITEVQPGTAISASQEFIELYNQSSEPIDLSKDGWQVQIASSKATNWSGAKSIKLNGTFYPGTYVLLASTYVATGESKTYLQDYATATFSPGLAATSGHVRVGKTAPTGLQSIDALEWSTTDSSGKLVSPTIDSGSVYVLETAIAAGSSIKRALDENGVFKQVAPYAEMYIMSSCPSPTANNVAPTTEFTGQAPLATTIDTDNPACMADPSDDSGSSGSTVNPPSTEPPAILLPSEQQNALAGVSSKVATPQVPAGDVGLDAPRITELLSNPGAPHTDTADEFIELYNSNDRSFDLSGFILVATKTKHYTFPGGTVIPAHTFKAFFSSETHLTMSNSSGQIALDDPTGTLLSQTDTYISAKDNMAWALGNGVWQWTARPTPNAQNIIVPPSTKTKKTSFTSKAGTKVTTATASATTKMSKKKTTTTDMAMASDITQKRPLHPLTLAVVGGFAILYGAYEYRRDVANKFYQFRSYRAARRATRQASSGR